ncbi:MAG: S8 family serine peptidase [Prochlorococcaceae cyanobacterium]
MVPRWEHRISLLQQASRAGLLLLVAVLLPTSLAGAGSAAGEDALVAALNEGQGITVALIDSGIDLRQSGLVGRLWTHPTERADGRDNDGNGLVDDLHGWDFVQGHGRPQDRLGHGTEMAGLILKAAPGARLMVLRVLNDQRRSDGPTVARAIHYARAQGAQVINLSLSSDRSSPEVSSAIQQALAAGVQVVAATGNEGRSSPLYPARLPGVLAVGATSGSGARKRWSNGGAGKGGEVVGIATDGLSTNQLGGGRTSVDGTSAAAALVSGYVAHLSSRFGRSVSIKELLQAVPSASHLP